MKQDIFVTCVTVIAQYHDLHGIVKWQNADLGAERLQTDKWHQRALLNASQESFLENNSEEFTVTPEDKFYLLYVYTKLSFL